MISINKLVRPETLQLGELYLFRERSINGKYQDSSVVKFNNYTACPAYVIIQNKDGKKIRCPRDDLFKNSDPNLLLPPFRLASLFELIKFSSGFIGSIFCCTIWKWNQ